MSAKLKPLSEQVMVITGASSGIGLGTARAAAKSGASVVLVARNEDALREIEQEIISAGGEAMYVVADVSFRSDLEQVARAAVNRFGRIDAWVNNAGLSIWGKLEEVSEEDHRRLFDVNFWGVVNGSLVAAPYLKRQGGALINLGSEVSDVAVPIQGMYAASKHAVKGFTDALRIELEEEGAPISVTLVKPAAINTPFTQHAKNYTGNAPKLPPPVYDPSEVAKAILHAATHPTRDIFVGGAGKMVSTLNKFVPRLVDWINEKVIIKEHFQDKPAKRRKGALYQAGHDGRVRGDYPGHVRRRSMYTTAVRHPVAASLCLAAAGVAMAAAINAELHKNGSSLFKQVPRPVLRGSAWFPFDTVKNSAKLPRCRGRESFATGE
jgi:short-subunit dehydrogenase